VGGEDASAPRVELGEEGMLEAGAGESEVKTSDT
jgi:hypothetical protein